MKRNIFAIIAIISVLSSCASTDEKSSNDSSIAYTDKDTSSFIVSDDSYEAENSSLQISADSSSAADSSMPKSSESNTPITFDDLPNGPGGLDLPPAVRPSEEDRKEFTDDGRPIVYFRKDTDQSVISEDGLISRSFEYVLNEEENCVDFTFVTVNNTDQICTFDGNYPFWALTDKTDLNTVFNSDVLKRTFTLKPGETKTDTFSRSLEDNWSILKLCVILAPDTYYDQKYIDEDNYEIIYDENAETIYLGSGSFVIEITR